MQIEELRDKLCESIRKKFPNNYSDQQRFIALVTQVGELGDLILIHDGVKKDFKDQHNRLQEAAFNVLIDLLVLCKQLHVDIEKEAELALECFKKI